MNLHFPANVSDYAAGEEEWLGEGNRTLAAPEEVSGHCPTPTQVCGVSAHCMVQ